MSEKITGEQFGAIITEAVDEMNRQWSAQIANDPNVFPRSMSANEWWLHFSTVSMPEQLLARSRSSS